MAPQVEEANAEIATMNTEIKELKAKLYGKFGSSINLDP